MTISTRTVSRRTLLKSSAAATVMAGVGAPLVARAQQAEFVYKFANNLPDTHPINVRSREMSAAIKQETNGRVDIQIFPSSQLGSDTDMLSQIRSGGVEFFTLSGLILATLVPAASINGIGFAFPDYPAVWKAMDGDLGAYIRAQITKANLVVMEKIWDNGFRQTTSSTKPINTPEDYKGFKIRVPVSPLWKRNETSRRAQASAHGARCQRASRRSDASDKVPPGDGSGVFAMALRRAPEGRSALGGQVAAGAGAPSPGFLRPPNTPAARMISPTPTSRSAIPTTMQGRNLENVATAIDCETVRQPVGVCAAKKNIWLGLDMDGLFYIGAALVALIFGVSLILRALRVLFALVLVGVTAMQYTAADAAALLKARVARIRWTSSRGAPMRENQQPMAEGAEESHQRGEATEIMLKHAQAAEQHYRQALALCPSTALTDLSPMHCQLGNLYCEVGQIELGREHFEKDVQICEQTGNRYGAGQTRINMAVMYLQASRRESTLSRQRDLLHRARAYAQAALRDFQNYQGRVVADENRAKQVLARIAADLAKLSP